MPPKSKTKSPKPQASFLNTAYLLVYNALSAALWATVLAKVVLTAAGKGVASGAVYVEAERFTRLTQTVAGLEVLHSLLGVVRAPVFTTLMQVASRFLLVWGIAYHFPQTTQYSPAYSSMLVAWSVTEIIRYSYFVFVIAGKGVPAFVTWLRYNTFLILYPIGISSETWLVKNAIAPAEKMNQNYGYALWAILAIYVPGSYVLFTHMLKQRRKIMSPSAKKSQ
ncbi:PTPLA-domain-containing protein [Pleomassaria siparia CBS 279.74]|uniref:Very-long-chain (3R)-3-hydroxyacyl-CoA dehydratase n=1 Tax=Pleomassaria siparia CBS 279.74 TaxID=1314801 RepID=A0A6G1JTJ4_9PLEO|nr:PTPLA-domain-containing protein [Pleomassaria siparia CBS 279.74]